MSNVSIAIFLARASSLWGDRASCPVIRVEPGWLCHEGFVQQ